MAANKFRFFWAEVTSSGHEMYPVGSMHQVERLGDGTYKHIGNKQVLPKLPFKFKLHHADKAPQIKSCLCCMTDYTESAPFISTEKALVCITCFERLFLPNKSILSGYKEALMIQMKSELNKG